MSQSDRIGGASQPAARPVAELSVRVGFVMRRTDNRWQPISWRLESVVPDDAGPLRLQLYRDEAEGYYLNVTTPEPSIFVQWRRAESDAPEDAPYPVAVTVSYNEAARWMDGGEQVDRVAMPIEMAGWLTEFVNLHYTPEQKRKRKGRQGQKASFMDREDLARLAEATRSGNAADGSGSL